ncbi:sporulation protein YpjB [Bacillus sp. FJAT-47783]|uniref:sporulation protein YpjB n=1 Tax=Bacillus sp. FJAT-47783 TaxID=2922712 RepID=UPI001FACDCAD|nr:sporulation protein YpjB [Bacillus sp. FJAT-47783]
MKKILWIFFVFIMLLIPSVSHSYTETDWEKLDQISNVAWQLAKQNRFTESEQLLQYFHEQLNEISLNDNEYSVDELKAIHSSEHHALETMVNEEATDEEKVKAVTQFRLVVDATISEHQPLWGTMEEPIMTTFSQLKSNMEEGDLTAFEQEWENFISLYGIIYPSLTVDVKDQNIKRVETHISAIEHSMYSEITEQTRFQQLVAMEDALKDIFNRANEDDTDPSLIWVIISTGSIIFLALTYAGWRKYKAETRKVPSKDHNK